MLSRLQTNRILGILFVLACFAMRLAAHRQDPKDLVWVQWAHDASLSTSCHAQLCFVIHKWDHVVVFCVLTRLTAHESMRRQGEPSALPCVHALTCTCHT